MQNKIQVFKNTEFGEIRAIEINGQPWFIGKDVASILGYERATKAIQDRVDIEDKDVVPIQDSIGRKQNTPIINESGMYSLILSSKLPKAKAFKRWVTSEVLPTIRKHGGYIADDLLDHLTENPEEAANFFNALKEERSKRKFLAEQILLLAPKARYYDIILQCKDAIPITVIAKDYGMSAARFNKLLHAVGIQFKINGTWLLYSDYCGRGYTITKTFFINDNKSAIRTYWTQRGRKLIYEILRQYGILPEVEVL